jgi:hypothetical protein
MQDQRICPALDDDRIDQAVLGLLLEGPEGLWSDEEVAQEIGDALAATDALARLHGAGLVHRLAGFVFAARPARVATRLAQ